VTKALRADYGRDIFRSDAYVAQALDMARSTVRRHRLYLIDVMVLRKTGRTIGRTDVLKIGMPLQSVVMPKPYQMPMCERCKVCHTHTEPCFTPPGIDRNAAETYLAGVSERWAEQSRVASL
jgi:hypothetical protein